MPLAARTRRRRRLGRPSTQPSSRSAWSPDTGSPGRNAPQPVTNTGRSTSIIELLQPRATVTPGTVPRPGGPVHRASVSASPGELLKPGWVLPATAGRSAAALAGADLHAVHAPALELAARQDRIGRVVAAPVGEVVLVGVLAHDLAGVPEGAGHGPPQPGHRPSPPDPDPTRCSARSSAWRARSSAVGNSPEGAHSCDSSAGVSARTGSRRPLRVCQQTRAASRMTTMIKTANRIESRPSTVELVTIWPTSSSDLAGGMTLPASRACWYLSRWAKKPIRGSLEKILYQLADRVTAASQASGTAVTQAHFTRPELMRMVVATVRATAASSWLAIPNSGNSWLMPPSGSVTPTHRK